MSDTGTQSDVIRIYRVQNQAGRGPWMAGFSHVWSDENWMPPAIGSIPPFQELLKINSARYFGFGCETLEGLANWISPGEFKTLLRYGFRVVSMEVDAIHWSDDFQCYFSRMKPLRAGVRREHFPTESFCAAV